MKAIIWAGLLGFIGVAIWGISSSPDFIAGMNYLIADPWGVMAGVDLLLGLLLFGVLVFMVEESKGKAALWTLSFFMIGNPAPAVYLILNFDKLKEKLSK